MDYCLRNFLALFVLLQVLARSSCQMGNTIYMDEAKSIFKTIFPTYNKDVPPRKAYPAPIMIDLTADIVHVSELDVVRQVLTSTIDLTVMWHDTRLGWKSQNVKEITIDKTMVWRPAISIVNAVDESIEVGEPELVLKGSGEIYWFRRLLIRTACPHDQDNKTTSCDIIFGAGIHLEYKLSDFGNVTDQTCSSKMSSTNMWDISMTGTKLEDYQIGNDTFKAKPEITCTVLLTKNTDCCGQSQSSSETDDSAGSQNLSSSLHVSGIIVLASTIVWCIFAQL